MTAKWTRKDKWASILVLLGFLFTALFWAVPSKMFINVVDYKVVYDDEKHRWIAYSTRELPFGSVWASWRVDFLVLRPEHDFVCPLQGYDHYRTHDDQEPPRPIGPTISYSVSPDADDCLNSGDPVSIMVSRRVWLFGAIPLRKSTFSFGFDSVLSPLTTPREDLSPAAFIMRPTR